ncbi:hypothetical protein ACP4J4_10305 [Aureimonas ureilytica]|uniref:hypothetical protein n=1 Tax=Aureimonas ureilytica TaxID=401562 RepID=UPI003CEFAA2A
MPPGVFQPHRVPMPEAGEAVPLVGKLARLEGLILTLSLALRSIALWYRLKERNGRAGCPRAPDAP